MTYYDILIYSPQKLYFYCQRRPYFLLFSVTSSLSRSAPFNHLHRPPTGPSHSPPAFSSPLLPTNTSFTHLVPMSVFEIPELAHLIAPHLDLTRCVRVNKTWHASYIPFLWKTVPSFSKEDVDDTQFPVCNPRGSRIAPLQMLGCLLEHYCRGLSVLSAVGKRRCRRREERKWWWCSACVFEALPVDSKSLCQSSQHEETTQRALAVQV